VEWSQRRGPFLGAGFRIRVIHCWWTFESIESARELLEAAFGEAGLEVAGRMKWPGWNTRLRSTIGWQEPQPKSAPAKPARTRP
jgi:hypothetical protein